MKLEKILKSLKPKLLKTLGLFLVLFVTEGELLYAQACKIKNSDKRKVLQPNIKRSKVEVKFWENPLSRETNSKGLAIYFGMGFNSSTKFRIYLNNKIVQEIYCKTNNSLGYCIDKLNILPQVFMPYYQMKEGAFLKIVTGKEFILIKLPLNYKAYNRLHIQKSLGWSVTFENNSESLMLE